MTIRLKLIASITLLAVLLLISGGTAFVALQSVSERTRTIVVDRVEPMTNLKTVADMYAVNIVDTAHKVRSGALDWAEGEKALRVATDAIDRSWTAYASTVMTSDEKALADGFAGLRESSKGAIDTLIDIIARKDQAALDRFVVDRLYPTIDPLATPISDLVSLQLRVAQEEFRAANDLKSTIVLWMSTLAVVSFIIVARFGWSSAAYRPRSGACKRQCAAWHPATRQRQFPTPGAATRSARWPEPSRCSGRRRSPTGGWKMRHRPRGRGPKATAFA
ncbi:hypothetical protein GCM10010836_31030 [Aminobacter aminovorans]